MKRLIITFACLCVVLAMRAYSAPGHPFIHTFTPADYEAHNRSFDIECDGTGYVFVANFEGLLVYNGVRWQTIYSKDYSRITTLCPDGNGRVYFGGYNVMGYARVVHTGATDSLSVTWIKNGIDDKACSVHDIGCVHRIFRQKNGNIVFVNEEDMLFSLTSDGKIIQKGKLNQEQTILRRQYTDATRDSKVDDAHGTLWLLADNAIVAQSTSQVFTRYTQEQGLEGQVMSLLEVGERLYIGTTSGLFCLKNGNIERIAQVKFACWSLVQMPDARVLAATADGVFCIEGTNALRQTNRHALSVCLEGSDSYLIGELEGLHSHSFSGQDNEIDRIPSVYKLVPDNRGGVWAITLDRETWYRAGKGSSFFKRRNDKLSLLFQYTDNVGRLWSNVSDAKGLRCDKVSAQTSLWLKALSSYSIQAMALCDSIAWLGGNFGLIRFNLEYTMSSKPQAVKAYIRDFRLHGDDLTFAAATNTIDYLGHTQYSYRINNEDDWSAWGDNQIFTANNIVPGHYNVQVRVRDTYGRIAVSKGIEFDIPTPFYERWYANLIYVFGILLLSGAVYRWRLLRIRRENEKLERLVAERTSELESVHAELMRKEKEAMTGKLAKGLVDRILNPMNYINNFAQLTLSLVRDLKADINDIADDESAPEDKEEAISDAHDVMQMMSQNLTKVGEHGQSTTRILKAMEEMLKQQTGGLRPEDVALIVDQCVEKLKTYYAKEIEQFSIHVIWQKPDYPIACDVVAQQLARAIMNILANSMYAIEKKAVKDATLSIEINPATGTEPPSIYLRDTGIGIEENVMPNIFDPFFTTKPTSQAAGLGLYQAKMFVENMGGTISVTSLKNEWTEVVISLL